MKPMTRTGIVLISLAFLAGCAAGPVHYQHYLDQKGVAPPQAAQFGHCRGYGCKIVETFHLSPADWTVLEAHFTPPPQTPEAEREALRHAIAGFENLIGPRAGTDGDQRGTFDRLGDHQHDCVDESTNTTIYLSLLSARGLLRFHDIRPPDVRIPLYDFPIGWPHQTAVIEDQATGQRFALDSWFHDNGIPAEIVPIAVWKRGWKPEPSHDNLPVTESDGL